jgi:hypothetical protein
MSVMRKALLWASTNAWMRQRAMRTGFVRASVKKFMPGERVEDAIQAAVELKPTGINTILTKLGENITHLKEAEDVFNHYMSVLALVIIYWARTIAGAAMAVVTAAAPANRRRRFKAVDALRGADMAHSPGAIEIWRSW